MKIKILGSNCPNCKILEANVRKAVDELGVEASVEKITDMEVIMGYGVMSIPALVIDEQVASSGRVLAVSEIKTILSKAK
jgi:small redox-active disulfide protein 2